MAGVGRRGKEKGKESCRLSVVDSQRDRCAQHTLRAVAYPEHLSAFI